MTTVDKLSLRVDELSKLVDALLKMPEQDQATACLVAAEVARWKEMHDQEFARRKRFSNWLPAIIVLSTLAGMGVGWLTMDGAVERIATDSVQRAEKNTKEKYSLLFNTLSTEASDSLQVASRAAKDAADAARIASEKAIAAAQEADNALKKAGNEVRKSLTEAAARGANQLPELIRETVQSMEFVRWSDTFFIEVAGSNVIRINDSRGVDCIETKYVTSESGSYADEQRRQSRASLVKCGQ